MNEWSITPKDMDEWRAARAEGREHAYWKAYAARAYDLSDAEADAAATRVIKKREKLARMMEVTHG